eukprot:NODE_10422_length_1353_cov_3.279772.p1 GENE.NODE_10422_length_1353_cov_3.279772~~NODE_10422_length_1353_cov_3.279772.p1  ORF type:complete len:322 (+),score=66.57 NODE_10422_length_1353_cov_3.279772:124-1089(+)
MVYAPHFLLPILSGCSLSFGGSVWLLSRLYVLRRPRARRLFSRQLWHLAFAGLFCSVADTINAVLEFGAVPNYTHAHGTLLCRSQLGAMMTAHLMCQYVEVHIALSFALAQYRMLTALVVLNSLLSVGWLVSVVIGFANAFLLVEYMPLQVCRLGQTDYLMEIILFIALAISFLAYVLTVVDVRRVRAPESVRNLAWRRALRYTPNFFLTYGPISIIFGAPTYFTVQKPVVWVASLTALSACGFLNTLTYAINKRYIHTQELRQEPVEEREPDALGSEVVSAEDILGVVSFHVAFASHVSFAATETESSLAPSTRMEVTDG